MHSLIVPRPHWNGNHQIPFHSWKRGEDSLKYLHLSLPQIRWKFFLTGRILFNKTSSMCFSLEFYAFLCRSKIKDSSFLWKFYRHLILSSEMFRHFLRHFSVTLDPARRFKLFKQDSQSVCFWTQFFKMDSIRVNPCSACHLPIATLRYKTRSFKTTPYRRTIYP